MEKKEIIKLLETENHSPAYYQLLQQANAYSRSAFQGKGYVFAQIGIDAQPCDVNCKFCSFARDSFCAANASMKTLQEVVEQAKRLVESGMNEMFLMTTANFPKETYLEYGRAVKEILPEGMPLVANVGDFDDEYAKRLKETGFTGVYHICRLREGTDTKAPLSARIHTLEAVKKAGLELYYCVEPIGPEHTYSEIADEILRATEYPVYVMAVMKRIAVAGTPLSANGEISFAELAKICAVSTLAVRPRRAMGVHEPDEFCLMAGANQVYAECGSNPRDVNTATEQNRGFSVADAEALLNRVEWAKK